MTDQKQLDIKYGADTSEVTSAQDRMAQKAEETSDRTKKAGSGIGESWKGTVKPILGVVTAIAGIGLGLEALGAPLERAETKLHQTITNTGRDFDQLRPRIDSAIDRMARLGFSSTDVDDALSVLTLKLKDPRKALDLLADAADIARQKNISLSDAADLTAKLALGNARAYAQFGIKVKAAVDPQKALSKATGEHAAALKQLDDARRRLNELQSGVELSNDAARQRELESATRAHARAVDVLAEAQRREKDAQALVNADGKVSLSESIRLRNAHESVAKAQERVSSTAGAVARAQVGSGKASASQQNRVGDAIRRVNDAQAKVKTTAGDVSKAQQLGAKNATSATQQYGKVHKAVHGQAQAAANTTAGHWRGMRTEVGNTLAGIGKRFSGVLTAIGPMTGIIGGITATIGPLVTGIAAIGLASAGMALAATAGIGILIIGVVLIIKHWGAISRFLKRTWADIKSIAGTVFGWLKMVFLNFTPEGLIIKHWASIKAFVVGVWHGLVATAKAVFGWLKMVFLNFTPEGQIIKHWQGIKRGVGAVIAWFKRVPGDIVHAFESLGGKMFDIGRSLLGGIERGIRLAGHELLSHLPGMLKKFIPGPIKKFFGISSPSKMAMGWGASIADGMAVGLENRTARVASASNELARVVQRAAVSLPGLSGRNVISLASRRPAVAAAPRPDVVSARTPSLVLGGGATTVINLYTTVHGSVRTDREINESIRGGLMKTGLRNSGALRRTA